HSSSPVRASKALKRRSLVAPTNTRSPPVTVGPALPELPTSCLPSGSSSVSPSTDSQRISPLFVSTAMSRAHGGRWQGRVGPIGRPFSSNSPLIGALKLKNGPTPRMLARSYGCVEPTASKLYVTFGSLSSTQPTSDVSCELT